MIASTTMLDGDVERGFFDCVESDINKKLEMRTGSPHRSKSNAVVPVWLPSSPPVWVIMPSE
jgi:hypothetical protein